jgi:hypothetical protein
VDEKTALNFADFYDDELALHNTHLRGAETAMNGLRLYTRLLTPGLDGSGCRRQSLFSERTVNGLWTARNGRIHGHRVHRHRRTCVLRCGCLDRIVDYETFEHVKEALKRPGATAKIRARLIDMLEAHRTSRGIQFDSRAWMITGRRYGVR